MNEFKFISDDFKQRLDRAVKGLDDLEKINAAGNLFKEDMLKRYEEHSNLLKEGMAVMCTQFGLSPEPGSSKEVGFSDRILYSAKQALHFFSTKMDANMISLNAISTCNNQTSALMDFLRYAQSITLVRGKEVIALLEEGQSAKDEVRKYDSLLTAQYEWSKELGKIAKNSFEKNNQAMPSYEEMRQFVDPARDRLYDAQQEGRIGQVFDKVLAEGAVIKNKFHEILNSPFEDVTPTAPLSVPEPVISVNSMKKSLENGKPKPPDSETHVGPRNNTP